VFPLASVSKPVAALGVLVAVDRGLVDLDAPAGPEGATVRHLLAHAAGYAFDAPTVLAPPGTRRIYSNAGFEVLGEHLAEATGCTVAEWVEEQVADPLGLTDLDVDGSPAAGYHGSVEDLLRLGRELLAPTLIPHDLWEQATSVQFPGLAGVLPGYGRQSTNDWGLGFEIRDHKQPHWTGEHADPRTFGHFGQSGSFLWVDPTRDLAAAFLGDQPFSAVHQELWPRLTDAILDG
jgi:CubicO group peptidase (beta-lactamase class C family)